MFESVNKSGVYADAYQGATVLSPGPSDLATVQVAIEYGPSALGPGIPCSAAAAAAARRLETYRVLRGCKQGALADTHPCGDCIVYQDGGPDKRQCTPCRPDYHNCQYSGS